MPNTPVNITNITPPRVPMMDARTGLISREWYRFFLNLFQLTGSGTNQVSLVDLQIGPPPIRVEDIPGPAGDVVPSPGTSEVSASINDVRQELETLPSPATAELAANLNDVRQELETLPSALTEGVISFSAGATGFTPDTATSGVVTLAGTLKVSNGGTGVTTTPTNGQLLIGNGTNYTVANLTAGSGVSITNSSGGISISATGSGGTVTSVGLSMPTQFTVTNSPVTGTGTLTAAWNSQTANYVFAGPTTGAAAAPTFRALVAADIPSLSYVSSVTGTSPVVSSGGATPAISLASGYGDTQNPYASKTANYVLAAPNGSAGVPTFRALAAADIPSLPYQPTQAPVTYTANFSVAATDVWIINNKSGSSCTVTLPTASSYSGRVLYFLNYQAQTLVSASSNVVPRVGGSAGTAILAAVAGDTATLVSDGTNWIMTQYTPNNVLLLE